jgi:hypothetical protein
VTASDVDERSGWALDSGILSMITAFGDRDPRTIKVPPGP